MPAPGSGHGFPPYKYDPSYNPTWQRGPPEVCLNLARRELHLCPLYTRLLHHAKQPLPRRPR